MKSKEDLLQRWQELAKFWEDEASRSFEHQHLNELIECMEEIERNVRNSCIALMITNN